MKNNEMINEKELEMVNGGAGNENETFGFTIRATRGENNNIELTVNGFATLEEAIREMEAAAGRIRAQGGAVKTANTFKE
ncbi:MAG: hypothetical protein CW338_06585 [Clostridiales bacterium]|nr:hypothetical protein [Clostridiales bacterium]